ncbi:MAG: hypothetical protein WAU28_04450 [Candidatus Moraniibacteriota bacterium]
MGTYDKQKMLLLALNSDFEDRILRLRKKWHIPKNGFRDDAESKKWSMDLLESPKNESFNEDFDQILVAFELSVHFREKIHEYLFFNTLSEFPEVEKDNIRFFWEPDKLNKGKERLFFEIYAGTTIKDVESIWNFVKEVQKSAVGYTGGRRKPKKVDIMERDRYIYSLSKQGMSHNGIMAKLRENMPDITYLYADDISKIIARMKQKTDDR